MTKFAAFITTSLFMLGERLENKDKGATMVEYGLMVALIAVVVMVAVGPLGDAIAALFDQVTAALPAA